MRTWLFIFLFIGIILGCDRKNSLEENNVIGKYVNTYEDSVNHYVELKSDSTFIHYYKRSNEPEKINKGSWRIIIKPKKTEIVFDTWTTFGYTDIDSCKGCLWAVKLRNKELVFNQDLPDEMNFRKVE